MKRILLIILGICFVKTCYCQQLKSILDGYVISKIPTEKCIVGSKWVTDLGAMSEGLHEDKLQISQSLNQFSIDSENATNLSVALLSMIGLYGYSSTDLSVVFNDLKIYTIKDLYDIPLNIDEKIVFSSIKVASFDLIYNRGLSSSIKAKLPIKNLKIDAEVDLGNKNRITINGANLFVAHKIVKIDKIKSDRQTKKLKNGFETDLMNYKISFNVSKLISTVKKRTKDEIGIEGYNDLDELDDYIVKYSKESLIAVDVMSELKGNLTSGIFNKSLNVCYCELLGNKKLYPINMVNSGDRITFDYLYFDNFRINYKFMRGVSLVKTNEPVTLAVRTSDNSKISIITKTYYISKVDD